MASNSNFALKIGCKIDEVRIDGDLGKLKQDLTHYRKIGLKVTELPVHGLDAIKAGRLDRRRLGQIKEILRDFDFTYSVHCPNPLNLMDREIPEVHRAVFLATVEFTAEIGSTITVYHPGRFTTEETFPINGKKVLGEEEQTGLMELEASIIQDLSAEFPDLIICLENARPYLHHSPYCYAESPTLLHEQLRRINRPNVKINLDFGHLFMASKFYHFDPLSFVARIKEYIAHTHIHDNFGLSVYAHEKQQTHQIPFGRGDSHMPVGWGVVPIKDLLRPFIKSYQGMFMMELRSRYFEQIEESGENLRKILNGLQ